MPPKHLDIRLEKTAGDPTVSMLLGMLGDARKEWLAELGNVPDDLLRWQAQPKGPSIGLLMLHLADAEGWWLGEVASGVARTEEQFARVLSKETQQYDSDWPAAPHQPLDWYLGILEETRAEIVALIAPRSDLETKHTAAGRDRTYTLRWILFHVIAHESYHGGQMVMLKEQWKQTRGG